MKKTVVLLFVIIAGSLLLSPQAFPGEVKTEKAALDNEPAEKPATEYPKVKLATEMGDIVLVLYTDKAPVTVDNFIKNTNNYHYDGLIFHRVIKGFMIQSGGHTFDLSFRESGREPIVNESYNGLSNIRGSIAMARIADPDSAQAQFFINHKNNKRLDARPAKPGYAVFGAVVSGMDVVDAIAGVEVRSMGIYQDVPVKPIRILKARLLNPKVWTALPEPKPEIIEPAYEMPVPLYR
jgi:cyclophilin family peptidyl-prolyl cis-trans isomerase